MQEKKTLLEENRRLKKRVKELEEQLNSCSESSAAVLERERLFARGPVVLFKWRNEDRWPVEYASENVVDMLGYDSGELYDGRIDYADLIFEQDAERVEQEAREHVAAGRPYFMHTPYRLKHRDGSLIWLMDQTVLVQDTHGTVTHFIGYVLDISGWVAAEQRWRFALEGSRDGVWDWDASTNKVFFSDRWKHMLGYSPDEIGDDLSEWESRVHPDDMAAVMADLMPHLEGRTPYYENVHRMLCRDGSHKWILDRGRVVERDQEGKPLRVIGTHTDLTEYKQAEKALEKARNHVFEILENTTDAFFELDRDYVMTYLNSRAEQVLGLRQQEVVGMNVWDIFPQAVDTIFYQEYTRAMETKVPVEFETYYPPLDIWVEVHAYPSEEQLSVYFRDITEKKRGEMERRQLFNLSLDLICVAGVDGMFRKVNPAWTRALGWSVEELLSKPWLDFVHPDDVERTMEEGKRLIEGASAEQFENRYLCKDGSYRWLSWNSIPVLEEGIIYAVVRDVTDMKATQQALESSEERLRFLVENAPVGMAMTDAQSRVLFINPRLAEMTGYTLDDFSTVEEWHRLTLSPEEAERITSMVYENMRKALSRQEVPPTLEMEVRCKDDSRKILQLQYVPIDDRGMTLFIDVTEQKRLEHELKRQAMTDPLTGIRNRRHYMLGAEKEFARFMRYNHSFALLMIDLDHFKRVNDRYGHDAGDTVLRFLANEIKNDLREVDIFGRLGGEEFSLLLPETTVECAQVVAERIRKRMEASQIQYGDDLIRVTISIGLALASQGDEMLDDILRRADAALYEAKSQGRNRVVLGTA